MGNETFLLILAIVLAFYMAWNMGANDVANAMGTSVGSGALTLRQALLVAALLEFAGAFFVGAEVSHTIENGIIHSQQYASNPTTLMWGMLSSLLATGIWLQIASYYGWPVSTTHSLIGALVGFGLVTGGPSAIYWSELFFIVGSWLVSPLLGGVLAYLIFSLIRRKILSTAHPLAQTKKMLPYFVFLVLAMLTLVIVYDGLSRFHLDFPLPSALLLSAGIGLVGFAIAYFYLYRYLPPDATIGPQYASVERLFVLLQIMSACCMAFAHGANDVANAIGPLASIIAILKTNSIPLQAQMPTWVLVLGGLGIVTGLATWGWRVIETIGKKLTELTPTRGFSAEFGAAITILVASKMGLPISTTHTLVGAVLGVGMARGIDALNLEMIRDIGASWVVTIPAGAILSIAIYYGFTTLLT